ncbi:hypothetical protein BZZ01_14290 [Nostocales cyanobacterium HT-58-2]|nr:hypothetical protein BZZ01_14290 [Nostocales cyanobacterium HT-58-2]
MHPSISLTQFGASSYRIGITDSKRYRMIHFGLTVFYSIMNLLHLLLDLFVQPVLWYQIVLIVFLLLVGLLLNFTAFHWLRLPFKAHEQ